MANPIRVSVESAMEMAIELHKRGELEEASTLYNDILKVVPEHPDALHFLGVASHQLGHSEHAIELVERTLELVPDYPDALNNLANILRETGKLERAEETYRKVLEFAPEHPETLINMATILRGLKQNQEAVEMIRKAIELHPENPEAWHNLGNIYRDQKMYEEALTAYTKSDELEPLTEDSSKEIAKILYQSGRKEDAIGTLERLLERQPNDALAQHMLASFGGDDTPERASDRYVRETFDTFSVSFDEALARLEYKAPRLVADRVAEIGKSRGSKLDILDIGCGTGLCGPLVHAHAGLLVGVDLSPRMLTKARYRKVYTELHEAELTGYMRDSERNFDAIICVDTFVYFGALDAAIDAAQAILMPGGHLIFTVERHEAAEFERGYRLQHHGRYSHQEQYLIDTLERAGLEVVSLEEIVPRTEGGKPVPGILAVARRPDE